MVKNELYCHLYLNSLCSNKLSHGGPLLSINTTLLHLVKPMSIAGYCRMGTYDVTDFHHMEPFIHGIHIIRTI